MPCTVSAHHIIITEQFIIILVTSHSRNGILTRAEFMTLNFEQSSDLLECLYGIEETAAIQGMLEDIWDSKFKPDVSYM